MTREVELKFLDVDFDVLRQKLKNIGATFLGKVFERNLVLDTPGRDLGKQETLLRLRTAGDVVTLTLKTRPAQTTSEYKIRDELEIEVNDLDTAVAVFEKLGFIEAFRYEKVRETWRVKGCEVCLDLLPFGSFVEVEGAEKDIAEAADALDLSGHSTSIENYHRLYRRYLEENDLPPGDSFVFENPGG